MPPSAGAGKVVKLGFRSDYGYHAQMEPLNAVVRFSEFSPDKYLFMATARGVVKKTRLSEFGNARTRGITAINLDENDRLIKALLTDGNGDVMLVTRRGQGLRIDEMSVRVMGRATRGVLGIRLSDTDELAGVVAATENGQLLLVTEFGYGKRTRFDEFSAHGRGTKGQIAYSVSERTGELVGVVPIRDADEAVLITSQGSTVKIKVDQISVQSRGAMGVRVVNIDRPDYVVGIGRAENGDQEDDTVNAG